MGPKWNPAVPQMSQLTSQKMHHPRQCADISSTGSLRTTVGQSMTRHTAEVWSRAFERLGVQRQVPGLPPSSTEFHSRPPVVVCNIALRNSSD